MTARRRVVVGTDAAGASVVVADEEIEAATLAPRGNQLIRLWGQDQPGSLGALDLQVEPYLPALGAWRASILTIEPDSAPLLPAGEGVVLPDLGAAMARGGGRGMHATDTVDLVLVLSGAVSLELDDGAEVALEPGDSLVQFGARHGWRNKGSEPATLAVFMVGASRD